MKKMIEFLNHEPLRENRWIIKTFPIKIAPYLFKKYKMYNEGEHIIFKTEFIETVNEIYNPKDLLNITDVTIEYLDPIGSLLGGLKFSVKGINFKQENSYSGDDLMTTKLRIITGNIEKIKLTEVEEKITEQPISYGQPKE